MRNTFIVATLLCAIAFPVGAKNLMVVENCPLQEQVSLNISFNQNITGFSEASAFVNGQIKKIQDTARQQGVTKLVQTGQNLNVSSQRENTQPDSYRLNGGLTYQVDNFANATKLAEALAKDRVQVSINSNAYRRGCNVQE
jgi:hypothetical protein